MDFRFVTFLRMDRSRPQPFDAGRRGDGQKHFFHHNLVSM